MEHVGAAVDRIAKNDHMCPSPASVGDKVAVDQLRASRRLAAGKKRVYSEGEQNSLTPAHESAAAAAILGVSTGPCRAVRSL
jgi:hypothetical protein